MSGYLATKPAQRRTPAEVRNQILRLIAARALLPRDRKALAELDIQTAQLNGDRLQGQTAEEVMSSQLAERWLKGESDIEPAAEWESLADRWARTCKEGGQS